MMKNTWQKNTFLPDGTTVLGISAAQSSAGGAGELWVCSPTGLFCEKNGQFTQPLDGVLFHSASAVLALEKDILVAGYPNTLFRSPDGGKTWFSSRVEEISSTVTCFVASPNFKADATVLAGSDGDGILRSSDGGNSWQLSNFGLGSLNILSLSCAPVWKREVASNSVVYTHDIIFAGTESGVYQSPNAGRAWRFAGAGLPQVPVLSIAVSPDFKRTSTPEGASFRGAVFAGTDGAGLHRSLDGCQSWQALESISTDTIINTLFFDSQGTLYMGTGNHGIQASYDLGDTWKTLLETDDIILCLAAHGSSLLAGTAENGLLVLENGLFRDVSD
jgi:photosystem II stability/assembly factor-like uncharacterized protein